MDALVLRDRDANGSSSDGLEERLYVQQDANYNVTALVNAAGTVVERYAYDPYGAATVLTAGWQEASASGYSWLHLHQGGRYDGVVGLYHFRSREYSPGLGRWLQRDPIEFAAGDANLYRYVGNGPVTGRDPLGLQGLFDLVPAQHYTGPSAVDQVEATLAARGRMLAQGGTPPPLMAGSTPVYGSDGNRTAMEAMAEAGRQIVSANAHAVLAPLLVTPLAPVVIATPVAVPLLQGDWRTAATVAITLVVVGGGVAVAGAGCASIPGRGVSPISSGG